MRLWILSDLHLDFGPVTLPAVDADAVVVAGDVAEGPRALEWLRTSFPLLPVVYVMGNHEYYQHCLPLLRHDFQRRCQGSNIHLLENTLYQLGEITFLGCTLWTDFRLQGHSAEPMRAAAQRMNDFKLIRYGEVDEDERSATQLEPLDTCQIHEASVRWLTQRFSHHKGERLVVVTHHAPSGRSTGSRGTKGLLSPAFASNRDALVESSGAALWVHGHVHERFDYMLGPTRIVCNPRGYAKHEDTGFDPGLVIEV